MGPGAINGGGALAPPPRRCAAPPASPPGSGPGSPVGPAGAPRPTASLPGPAGQGFVLVGPLVVGPLVAQPLRGARGPPGPVRFACAAAPARPRWGPSPRCGIGFGAPPAVRGLPCRWPGPGLGLLAGLRLGGRGCPLWGGPSSRLVPRSGLVRPPCAPPCSGAPGAAAVAFRAARVRGCAALPGALRSPLPPSRPAVPAGDSGKPEARLGGLRPPSALRRLPPWAALLAPLSGIRPRWGRAPGARFSVRLSILKLSTRPACVLCGYPLIASRGRISLRPDPRLLPAPPLVPPLFFQVGPPGA